MTLNPIAEKAASQEMAVALSNSVGAELTQVNRTLQDDRRKAVRTPAQENVEQVASLLEAKSSADQGFMILSGLVSKLASQGIRIDQKEMGKRAEKDWEIRSQQDGGTHKSGQDEVVLRNSVTAVEGWSGREGGQEDGRGGQQDQSAQSGAAAEIAEVRENPVRQYVRVVGQFIMGGGSDLKRKLEALEGKLSELGMSAEEILATRIQVTNSIRGELAQQIEQQYLKLLTSPSTSVEFVINEKSLNDVLDFIYLNDKLGGWDFGNFQGSLQGTAEESGRKAVIKIRDTLHDAMEAKLMERQLAGSEKKEKELTQELKQLLKLAQRVGFNTEEFAKNWQVRKWDVGLFAMPEGMLKGSANGDQGARDQGGQQREGTDEKLLDMGREFMGRQLRAIYMQRALRGDFLTLLQTSVKMRKLKNGLIRLGVETEQFRQLEKEGKALAQVKLLEMFKEVSLERASHHDLAAPSMKLVEEKERAIVENLDRLGCSLSPERIQQFRDQANRTVHGMAVAERASTLSLRQPDGNSAVEQRLQALDKLIARLEEETTDLTSGVPMITVSHGLVSSAV